MCGICGIINFNEENVQVASLNKMMETMKHRGPDDEGVFIENNIGFGFVRLSIIDLSPAGHQPMHSFNNRYVIIFNGEIYNYIEIREELILLGYKFITNTDTEVLQNSYIEWGENCLNKFNGMFAFVIYDKKTEIVFGARDRFGIKPFYYYQDEEQFIFASEIPPILKIFKNKPTADFLSIYDYLVFNRTDQTNATFFKNIKKLQHSEKIKITKKEIIINKWYNLRENLSKTFSNPEEFYNLFSDTCNLYLRSDVPVGVCLSGGLDSSSIVSTLIDSNKLKNINTFSAIYGKGITGDESGFINEYKELVDNMYFITPTAESLFNDMHKFIYAHAEPIPGTSPYAQYKVLELAKNNVTVTLDGQGADEQLGGYHYFFGLYFKELLRKFKIGKLIKEIFYYIKVHHSFFALKTFLYFLLPQNIKNYARVKEKKYLNKVFIDKFSSFNKVVDNIYNSNSLHNALLDHFEFKLEHLLKWEDRNSMFFSIESRVPFLDHRIVEKTLALHNNMIIKNGQTKYILRKAMANILPEKIRVRRDKVGFETPEASWFREDYFQKFIFELLNSDSFKKREIIIVDKALDLYKQHIDGSIDISKEIWKWINLELWFRVFID